MSARRHSSQARCARTVTGAVRLAIAQMVIGMTDDPALARNRAVSAAEGALREGARIVVLPEMAVPGYTTDPVALARLAEPVPGPTTEALMNAARATDGLIVVGLAETSGGKLFNTAVAISPDGVVGHYRKLHLFDREKESFAPGDLGLRVFDTPLGRIGLCICYDLRFPEVARILALRGANLICAPAAWVTGFDKTRTATPTQVQGAVVQANLNQVFIACASHAGQPGDERFLGCSVLVDPFGELLIGPLSSDGRESATAEVDLERCRDAQHRSALITPRVDRRTEVYGIVCDGECL